MFLITYKILYLSQFSVVLCLTLVIAYALTVSAG